MSYEANIISLLFSKTRFLMTRAEETTYLRTLFAIRYCLSFSLASETTARNIISLLLVSPSLFLFLVITRSFFPSSSPTARRPRPRRHGVFIRFSTDVANFSRVYSPIFTTILRVYSLIIEICCGTRDRERESASVSLSRRAERLYRFSPSHSRVYSFRNFVRRDVFPRMI